jgi:hypothetical protein
MCVLCVVLYIILINFHTDLKYSGYWLLGYWTEYVVSHAGVSVGVNVVLLCE